MIRTLLTLVIGTCVAGLPAYAHHSFATYYLEDQSISIQGDVQEFQYRNPHAILLVTARSPEGRPETYAAEWAGTNRLAAQGVTKETLKPGDFVIVTGSPGRPGSEYKMHLKGIQRPADGWAWSGGGRRR